MCWLVVLGAGSHDSVVENVGANLVDRGETRDLYIYPELGPNPDAPPTGFTVNSGGCDGRSLLVYLQRRCCVGYVPACELSIFCCPEDGTYRGASSRPWT